MHLTRWLGGTLTHSFIVLPHHVAIAEPTGYGGFIRED